MRALLQRSGPASVEIAGRTVGSIDHGLVVLVCAMPGDTEETAVRLAGKIAALRIFADAAGRMNRSVRDTGGAVLAVSQFTLAANTRRGNRPDFSGAAASDDARQLYAAFCDALRAEGLAVATGAFGADMRVHLVNDGPVTISIDTATP
jgi:D-tyrosyl-tRNA(Tyr) deacylase